MIQKIIIKSPDELLQFLEIQMEDKEEAESIIRRFKYNLRQMQTIKIFNY